MSLKCCGHPRDAALISQMTLLLSCGLAPLIHRKENKGFEVQEIFDANALHEQLNVDKMTENSSNIHEGIVLIVSGVKNNLILCLQISLGFWGLC